MSVIPFPQGAARTRPALEWARRQLEDVATAVAMIEPIVSRAETEERELYPEEATRLCAILAELTARIGLPG